MSSSDAGLEDEGSRSVLQSKDGTPKTLNGVKASKPGKCTFFGSFTQIQALTTIVTPEVYCQRILSFSKQSPLHSFYSGKHYAAFARMLISSFQSFGGEDLAQAEEDSFKFVLLYDLGQRGKQRLLHFHDINEFDQYDNDSRRARPSGRLLFFRGYPSSRLLNFAGSKFDIDPEFFLRHLYFPQTPGITDYHYLPSLPSAGDIIQLCVITVGVWNDSRLTQSLEQLRKDCMTSTEAYLNQLALGRNVSTCSSIVRQFDVHDKRHFTIEQTISILLDYSTKGWIGTHRTHQNAS